VTTELDPLIHVPTRLRIVATLAALPDGDALSFTRLQDMLGLTPGNLIIQLRKLEDAGYISSTKTRNGSAQRTTVALTGKGRTALSAYIQALRDLLGGLDAAATSPAAPATRLAGAGLGPGAGQLPVSGRRSSVSSRSMALRKASCSPGVSLSRTRASGLAAPSSQ
jgi:DNA-binding MarR family transcriptional regulator